jgi:hypothetical protein
MTAKNIITTPTKYYLPEIKTGPARIFRPHNFKTRIVADEAKDAHISLMKQVRDDMYLIVDEVNKEVGWVGTVKKLTPYHFLIEEIFLIGQKSNGHRCRMTTDGISEWGMKMIMERGRENGKRIINTMRFWGHSHNWMPTNPTPQDNDQMEIFFNTCKDFFIRGIMNKEGRMEFTLYLFDKGIIILDVPWSIYEENLIDESRRERWKSETLEKIAVEEEEIPEGVVVEDWYDWLNERYTLENGTLSLRDAAYQKSLESYLHKGG